MKRRNKLMRKEMEMTRRLILNDEAGLNVWPVKNKGSLFF